jgi:hypothetical protein
MTGRAQIVATMALGCIVFAAVDERQIAVSMAALGLLVGWTFVSERRRKAKASGDERDATVERAIL